MDHFWPFWWQKSQKLTFVQKWIIFAYFVKKGPKFVSHDSLSGNNEKINYLQKVQKWTIFWPFWWQKSKKLTFVQKWIIFAYFVKKGPKFVSHDSLSGNNEKNKLSPKSPKMDHFLTILMAEKSKMVKNGPFLDFLEIVYFFVISTQGIMGNKLRTLFHKISKNYPLLHWSQFLPFLQSKWWKNGLFLHFLEIVYFFVISTQGIITKK